VTGETPARLAAQLAFVREIDEVKGVLRQTILMDGSRRENDAEHSWHIAVTAAILAEHAPAGMDLLRVIRMLLIHDLVEIDCGDVFCYDTEAMDGKHEREARAADRIFGMLPPDQGGGGGARAGGLDGPERKKGALWDEFEARETTEARYANALDRLQPMLHNLATEGHAWRKHRVTADRVLRRNRVIRDGAPALWEYARGMVADAVRLGYVEPGPDFDKEMQAG
jgi:putative hydrolase of HD superfamily